MKRFAFRLDRVARVREIERDRARGTWVQARAEEVRITERLADLRTAAEAQAAGYGDVATQPDLRAAAFRAGLRAQAVEVAVTELRDASAVTAEAAGVLHVAQRRVDALGRLEARKREEWTEESRRAETLELDDLSTTRAGRTPMGAEGPR
ncbi:hypothetical protein [Euzebya sp.]|uniref:hypothetical protein n=1 Tax=Euzebya sp. TaxID=1971409 RepID=UPI00351752F6